MTGWSGGDEGIRLDPATAVGWGIDFGSPLAIYFLVAGWSWIATLVMFALTRTPLGCLMNAARDNPERLEFVGFSPVLVRGLALSLSAGFAGIAGALYALTVQVVTLDTLGLPQSTTGMLHAYIGGHTAFFGPVIGAVFITVVAAHLSALTDAWPLYLGFFFVAVVIFMRNGLCGSLVKLRDDTICSFHKGCGIRFVYQFIIRSSAVLIGTIGLVLVVEMVNSLSANRGDPITFVLPFKYLLSVDPHSAAHWIFAAFLICVSWKILRLNHHIVVRKTPLRRR
jgi:branched-chain amino acid transport system permease protein